MLQYNASGRIERVTGSGSVSVQYSYDASGKHLVAVQGADGQTTRYVYNGESGGSSAHALTEIRFPDGLSYLYFYDDYGRLIFEGPEDGKSRLSYAYDELGTLTTIDELGTSIKSRIGPDGNVLHRLTPDGGTQQFAYNRQALVSQITGPQGGTYSLAYDARANLSAFESPSDQLVKTSFDPIYSRITRLVDARNSDTSYTRDAYGKLTSIAHPDASMESFGYDTRGNLVSRTNRRQQSIDYERNHRGQLTRKNYPDGRSFNYDYDARGNLILAQDSLTGSIVMAYDAGDHLTRIEYPEGYWFEFEYDAVGRRTRRTDQEGYVLEYGYDLGNRLAELRDNRGMLVAYVYDPAGSPRNSGGTAPGCATSTTPRVGSNASSTTVRETMFSPCSSTATTWTATALR
ncbi:MAG: RHS repeat protein [Gammaproteobacteria bacterium]|nr:RHS repeat protein [Gammaproteobacteria bacterium]